MNTASNARSQNDPTSPLACSIVIPVYNEEDAIAGTVRDIARIMTAHEWPYEVIIVNDGSTDATAQRLEELRNEDIPFQIVVHEVNQGYGASLKSGIRQAKFDLICITDADGTYPNADIPKLIKLCRNQEMVVGARVGENVDYSKIRAIPKVFLRAWVSWIARRNVPDINSGLRVFRKQTALNFFGILPNGFSFTITITLAMLTNYHSVHFEPISYRKRTGKSKIKPIKDTLRFLMIILRTGTYFAPLRIFLPAFAIIFLLFLAAISYDVFFFSNISDKTIILLMIAINIGMFGLLADMIDKRNRM